MRGAQQGIVRLGASLIVVVCCFLNAAGQSFIRTKNGFASLDQDHAHVERLLRDMTLDEKISQLSSRSAAIDRLGITAFNFWSECLHGAKEDFLDEGATIYPSPLGLASTWDKSLLREIGGQIGTEMRAKSNAAVLESNQSRMLNCFDPNINIARDPRWGRVQETYGEDPHLTGTLASHFVQGLQEGDDRFLKVGATCKHFAAYNLEQADGTSRFRFDAQVSSMDAHETYLPAFEACTRAGVSSVMCSYNAINGVPACADVQLLNDTLRNAWGFEGFVVSDCGAVEVVKTGHSYRKTLAEAAAVTLKAGTDMSCEDYSYLRDACDHGLVTEEDITRAARRVLRARSRLGLFQPPGSVPFAGIGPEVIGSAKHKAAAVQAVEEGAVLLKNVGSGSKRPLLPLDKNAGERIVVAGPMAHTREYMLGNYYGRAAGAVTTPFMAIKEKVDGSSGSSLVEHHPGSRVDGWFANGVDETIGYCGEADVCILCLGTSSLDAHSADDAKGAYSMWSPVQENEMLDRRSLRLPGVQEDLVKGVAKYTKAHIIVILIHGGPLDVSWLQQSERVGAIMTAWYPGQGAAGIANLLFGDAEFAGRLPLTFVFENYTSQIAMTDMRMSAWPGRTYRYLQVPVLYPFGHGLSYASFQYTDLKAAHVGSDGYRISVHIQNTGARSADEVAMLFVRPLGCPASNRDPDSLPSKSLKGFERVHLKPRQQTQVTFMLPHAALALHGIEDARAACRWSAEVGDSSVALHAPSSVTF